MALKDVIFWCEFPKKINWNEVKKLIDFDTEIYVAVETKKEYLKYKKLGETKYIKINAWPVLPKNEGYWFSGFCSKESIDKLDQFKGIPIKLDIETPLPEGNFSYIRLGLDFLVKVFLRKAKNNEYLKQKIIALSKTTPIILSGFSLPKFIIKRFGDLPDLKLKNIDKNYIQYSTLRLMSKGFIKKHHQDSRIALGCIGTGIFGDEPIYKNISEFKKDLETCEEIGVRRLTIFNVSGILERKKPKLWFDIIKNY